MVRATRGQITGPDQTFKHYFRVTGGLAEFRHVTAEHFHNLIAALVMDFFVNDGGMAADTFEEGMEKLRTLLK